MDTIFFVLRKKQNQVTTLHVIHHSLMPFVTWCFVKLFPDPGPALTVTLNAFVHVVMYIYYYMDLTTIDLNPFLDDIAHDLSIKYPLVKLVDGHVANAENMTCFEDNTFDIVVGTLIMCCINDNKAALREIRRVLKPNGRYYFMEGNRMQPSRSAFIRLVQKIFAEFWIVCEYGCKFMKNNFDEKLKQTGMSLPLHRIHRIRETGIGHELHYGCAMKVNE